MAALQKWKPSTPADEPRGVSAEDLIRWTDGRALEAQRAGVATQTSPEELRDRVATTQWAPEYRRRVVG